MEKSKKQECIELIKESMMNGTLFDELKSTTYCPYCGAKMKGEHDE